MAVIDGRTIELCRRCHFEHDVAWNCARRSWAAGREPRTLRFHARSHRISLDMAASDFTRRTAKGWSG